MNVISNMLTSRKWLNWIETEKIYNIKNILLHLMEDNNLYIIDNLKEIS